MKEDRKIRPSFAWIVLFRATLVLLSFWPSTLPSRVLAQTINPAPAGENAIWQTSTKITGSQAFVDAAAWCPSGNCSGQDFCAMVNDALLQLQSLSSVGGVVDARGVATPTPPLSCASNPFSGITVPSTVLLPPLTIQIVMPWILPSNTRISGQGRQTILQATASFSPDTTNAMIEMASTAGSLNVVVEHVKLDGTVQAGCKQPCVGVSGIYNGEAQDGSYVDDVEFYGLGATSLSQSSLTTGLFIDTGAAGSGPYSKITFSGVQSHSCTDTSSPPSCSGKAITCPPTAAVQIRAATRGLHSLTTTTLSTQCKGPFAGIYLDASDTTIEDVHSEGFYDAIVVGANAAQGAPTTVGSNMVWNVTGGYGGNSGPTTNTIHVCNPTFGSQTGACSSASDAVSDLAIFQVQSSGGYKNGVTAYHATTIEDDLTGTTINSNAFPTYVGTYILGEPVGTSQYSRFATTLGSTNGSSATVPTWAVGSTVLTGLSCTTPGAIYSNTRGSGSGTGSNTLYLCSGSNWLAIENQ